MASGLLNLPILLISKLLPPKPPTTSFEHQTVLITGSNTGLGYEAALIFLKLNASRIILGVRTPAKGYAAKASLEDVTGKKDIISVLQLDMDSYASIKVFVKQIESEFGHVDIAVLNAALTNREYKISPHGWEETLQVNTLSTTLLALLLLPSLRKARVVNSRSLPHLVLVSSGGYVNVPRLALPNPPLDVVVVQG